LPIFMVDLRRAPCVERSVSIKVSDALRFLGGLVVTAIVLVLLVLRVTSCAPTKPPETALVVPPPPPPAVAAPVTPEQCLTPAFEAQAQANRASLTTLAWAPFGRAEIGWEIYAPLIAREIGTACPPTSPAFAAAFARWQAAQGFAATGVMADADFNQIRGVMLLRRPFVRLTMTKVCPEPTNGVVEPNRPGEGYGGKQVFLRPTAFAAYRRMVEDARKDPAIAADPRNLTIFSGYRSPTIDAQRCVAEGNCDGVVRATCSAHRTGLAMDLYVGQAPGFGPDSSADPNRLYMSRTATYRWLVANADRYGFINYPFEPWHWEWTGEAP
jgi:hypothetical protein